MECSSSIIFFLSFVCVNHISKPFKGNSQPHIFAVEDGQYSRVALQYAKRKITTNLHKYVLSRMQQKGEKRMIALLR